MESIKENIGKAKSLLANHSFDKAISKLKAIRLTNEEKKELKALENKYKTYKKESQAAANETDNSSPKTDDFNRFIDQIIKNRAISFISKSHLNKAFDILKLLDLTDHQENKLVLFENRLNRIQSNFMDGLISSENREIETNKLTSGLVRFIKSISVASSLQGNRLVYFSGVAIFFVLMGFGPCNNLYFFKSNTISINGEIENCKEGTEVWYKINNKKEKTQINSRGEFKLDKIPRDLDMLRVYYGQGGEDCSDVYNIEKAKKGEQGQQRNITKKIIGKKSCCELNN